MAMAVLYDTFDGMLVSENRGGTVTYYTPDTLGSLTLCRDATGAVTYTADYWPYGELRSSTGANPSPWGFVGLLGYLTDTANRLYVRMRHYLPKLTRWLTVDPLWPGQPTYAAFSLRPEDRTDIYGLSTDLVPVIRKLVKNVSAIEPFLEIVPELELAIIIAEIGCKLAKKLVTELCTGGSGQPWRQTQITSCDKCDPDATLNFKANYFLACFVARIAVETQCYAADTDPDHADQLAKEFKNVQKCIDAAHISGRKVTIVLPVPPFFVQV